MTPSALELVSGYHVRSPKTASGIYLDSRPGHDDIRMRFVHAAPDRWVWLHVDDPTAGAITDGTTNIVIDDGVAVVVTPEGSVRPTHRLSNLLNPVGYDFDGWTLGDVRDNTVIGRPAGLITATPKMKGKAVTECAFDRETGIILCMRSDGFYLGFEEIDLDISLADNSFTWSGPVDIRPAGVAHVVASDDTYSCNWEIGVRGQRVFHHHSERLSRDDAIRWAEARAAQVYVRDDK